VTGAARGAEQGPVIYSIWATPRVVHGGDLVQWSVRTSPDVTRVIAGIPAYEVPLERRGSGRFWTAFHIPANVPAFFRHDYRIVVHAFGAGGQSAESSLTMRLQ